MDIGRYLVEAHLREGRSVAELAAAHDVHRSWLYKLLVRYRREGETALAPRSRRPHSSPSAVSAALIEKIVALREQLLAQGLDGGAVTIHTCSPEGVKHAEVITARLVQDGRGWLRLDVS